MGSDSLNIAFKGSTEIGSDAGALSGKRWVGMSDSAGKEDVCEVFKALHPFAGQPRSPSKI